LVKEEVCGPMSGLRRDNGTAARDLKTNMKTIASAA
jgi:hypothetical protein